MRQRTLKKPFSIDVMPFLSILAFIPLVFALVLILLGPVKIFRSGYLGRPRLMWEFYLATPSGEVRFVYHKKPTIFVCGRGGVMIYPGKTLVAWDELQQPNSAVIGLLDKLETNSSKECVLLLVRPEAKRCFELMRRILSVHNIEVLGDVVDAKFELPQKIQNMQGYLQDISFLR